MRATRLSTGRVAAAKAVSSAVATVDKDSQAIASPCSSCGRSPERRPSRRNNALVAQHGARCTTAASQPGPVA